MENRRTANYSACSDIPNVFVLATDGSTNQLQPVRQKIKNACTSCKERKVRCDGELPCLSCQNSGLKCLYMPVQRTKKRNHKTMKDNSKGDAKFRRVIEALFPGVTLDEDLDAEGLISVLRARLERPTAVEFVAPKVMLPPKQIAFDLISKTWDSACLLFRFYHRPTFLDVVESLYDVADGNYTERQLRFLPLVYSVIAVGALFSKSYSGSSENKQMTEFFQDEGHKFFVEAKTLLDPITAEDVESLQALFMLTIFLQCNANLSSGYSYIGLALRTAIKHNFHRKTSLQSLDHLQSETIKRLFWTIYKTDIYMNCILGLPNSLDESLVDQDFPLDIDDDKIFVDKLLPQAPGKLSSCGMNNEHTKLILIMNNTHKILYPMSLSVTSISHNDISRLESDLSLWLTKLPVQLQPGFEPPSKEYYHYLKPNRYLHLDYLHAEIMIYRPFIHYLVLDTVKFPNFQFHILMANKCIKTARKVIQLAVEMDEQNLLNGVYWFSVHTIFFSVACLLYFLHQMKLKNTNVRDFEIEKDCKNGFSVLLKLKNVSLASSKTFEVLNLLFEKLNQKTLDLSKTVLTTIIERQKQHELEQFTNISDLFMENNVEENLVESELTPSEVDSDFLSKILYQFSSEGNRSSSK